MTARGETLNAPGNPVMLQMGFGPAYGLTVHKTQALSIKHIVRGCLEGVFAQDCFCLNKFVKTVRTGVLTFERRG